MAQKSNLPFLQSQQKQQIQTSLLPLPKDTVWMDEFFAYAVENHISEEKLSHHKKSKTTWSKQCFPLHLN